MFLIEAELAFDILCSPTVFMLMVKFNKLLSDLAK